MELSKEYILSQYQELGMLNGYENVRIVRNSITGKIAVKKYMKIEQKPIYAFLQTHKNEFIPQIYGYFEHEQQLIVIEEYIEGRNLEDILCEYSLSEEAGVCIVKELCCGLYPLHAAKPAVICRDLKPENIMLTSTGHVKLIDFDIARVVSPEKNRDTVIMGTEGYAAPEQFGRRQTDSRSDIYALGTILNYMILQKFPVEEIAPGKLGQVVRRCIAVNPDERYQNVKDVEKDLEKLYPSRKSAIPKLNEQAGFSADKFPDGLPAWRRFLPPGFRSGSIWKMLLAIIGYLMIIDLCLSMEIKEGDMVMIGAGAVLQKILCLLAQLAEIAVVFNYLGIRDKIPGAGSDSRIIRIVGYVILEFVFMVIAVLLWSVLELLI